MFGASLNEVGLVALFLGIVLLASKVGKVGEVIGALFEPEDRGRRDERGGGEPKAGDGPPKERSSPGSAEER